MTAQFSSTITHVFLLALLSFPIISTTIHACNLVERSSLLSFSLSISSPPLNWTSVDCCHWNGITCNQDGLVTRLLLPSKGLNGGMKLSSFANLTHLTNLNLSRNSLYGSLGTDFFVSFNRLEVLDLSYNLLSGDLPFSLPRYIRTLDLSSNHFHGEIPSSFFQQAWNLTSFNVRNNIFFGYIPSSICLLSSPSIAFLDFSLNGFNGTLPPGLGDCSKLRVFRAGHNNLSGFLPEDVYNATKLEEIALTFNSFYGGISDWIVNLTNLAILDLPFNQLNGAIPLHLGKLSKLSNINLDFNHLQGYLPLSLMNCSNLVELHFAANNLEGDLSMLNFSKLSQLSKLDLVGNDFTGLFPTSLYSCKSLTAVRLSINNIEGQIQPEILSLKSLSFLSLTDMRLTNLTGAVKILTGCRSLRALFLSGSFIDKRMLDDDHGMVDFDGLQNLRVLSLTNCQLTGQLPAWLAKLKNLEILILVGNRITGPIPSWLGTLPRLFHIRLQDNVISGEFPKQLCNLPGLVHEVLAAQGDHYAFELPVIAGEIEHPLFLQRTTSYLPRWIDMSNNKISGSIPSEIGQLQFLHKLSLGGNNFSGNIPNEMSNLKNLETLNLSRNHLSGNIPITLTSLTFLKEFDVSYNDLEGPIPTRNQFISFDASVFQGNPELCGVQLLNKCGDTEGFDSGNNKKQDVENEHELPWFYIFTALGFVIGFWGVCGSLIVKKTWRYAYFRFADNVQDKLCLMIEVRINWLKKKV